MLPAGIPKNPPSFIPFPLVQTICCMAWLQCDSMLFWPAINLFIETIMEVVFGKWCLGSFVYFCSLLFPASIIPIYFLLYFFLLFLSLMLCISELFRHKSGRPTGLPCSTLAIHCSNTCPWGVAYQLWFSMGLMTSISLQTHLIMSRQHWCRGCYQNSDSFCIMAINGSM